MRARWCIANSECTPSEVHSGTSAIVAPYYPRAVALSPSLRVSWINTYPCPCSLQPTSKTHTPHPTQPRNKTTHLIHNISIKCCSAKLFSLFTFLCNAVKIVLFSSNAFPAALLIALNSSFGVPAILSISVRANPPGLVIEKYSNSSRRTMMACLTSKGLPSSAGREEGGETGTRCC